MGNEQRERLSTDEINLVRLIGKLEKRVADEEEWRVRDHEGVPVGEVVLRVRKTGQMVKFARGLVKSVEIESEHTPARLKRLNESKIQLDRMEKFLNELRQTLEPKLEKGRVSLLSTLPLPVSKKKETGETRAEEGVAAAAVTEQEQQLSIIPPDPDEIAPSLLTIDSLETAKSSGFNLRTNQSTTVLHEELSLQLEQMARQLKRNAIHFSESLGSDKAAIEDAGMKIERNYDVMVGQRVKLRDRTREGWKHTCVVVGLLVLVVVVFLMVVVAIRITTKSGR